MANDPNEGYRDSTEAFERLRKLSHDDDRIQGLLTHLKKEDESHNIRVYIKENFHRNPQESYYTHTRTGYKFTDELLKQYDTLAELSMFVTAMTAHVPDRIQSKEPVWGYETVNVESVDGTPSNTVELRRILKQNRRYES